MTKKKKKRGLKFKNIFSFACLFVFVVVIIIDSRDPDTKIENFIYGGLIGNASISARRHNFIF